MAVHLIGRRKENEWTITALPRSFEDVECAARVYLKVSTRIIERCCHRDLGCKMIDLAGRINRLCHCARIAYIGDRNFEAARTFCHFLEPYEVVFHIAPRKI